MPNGNNVGGPDLRGPRRVIWIAIAALFGVLIVVYNHVSGGALW